MSQNQPKWRVRTPCAGEAAGVEVYDGDQYVCQMSHHPAERQMAKDYAARIVACVNACEGIGNENAIFLPDNNVRKVLVAAELKRVELERQRDELLAALVAFREDVSDNRHAELASVDPYSIDQEVLDKIDAAIARVKGGAA